MTIAWEHPQGDGHGLGTLHLPFINREGTAMLQTLCKRKVTHLFSQAGVTVNGEQPWDIQVQNERFYPRVLTAGSLGLGESYMEGWWECERLDDCVCRLLRGGMTDKLKSWSSIPQAIKAKLGNRQKKSRAFEVGERHYDLGNDIYQAMLDPRMIYSCAFWRDAADLRQAQEKKLELICAKLHLEPGMRVLDIGCGWGGTARYLAEKHGVEVVGVTISREQAQLAKDECQGLPVTIHLQDYRDLHGCFDRIVSIGMFEHVGYKNYRTFMEVARRCLKEDGLFLLHTIGGNTTNSTTDPWIERYVFPNSMLPSARQVSTAAEGLFVIEDWHNFGIDYDRTLMSWFANFDANWQRFKPKYGQDFYRMWKFYLLSCAGSFRARRNQVWQIVLSPNGLAGGYCPPWRFDDKASRK